MLPIWLLAVEQSYSGYKKMKCLSIHSSLGRSLSRFLSTGVETSVSKIFSTVERYMGQEATRLECSLKLDKRISKINSFL